MLEINIEKTSMLQLEKAATERGDTPTTLVERIIRRFLHEETQHKMQREIEAFVAMHSQLREQYPDAYVAIHQGKLVDHDENQLDLYERIEEKYPYEVVLIRQVLPEAKRIYTFRSPKVEYA